MMTEPIFDRLLFWHFFEGIEYALSYERDLPKYKQFWATLAGGYIPLDEDLKSFRRFCKIMYLQNVHDEKKFDAILDEAIIMELDFLIAFLQKNAIETPPSVSGEPKTTGNNTTTNGTQNATTPTTNTETGTNTSITERPSKETTTKYFKPKIQNFSNTEGGADTRNKWSNTTKYLHSDEYFAVTRRQMVKGWQYLRRREQQGTMSKIDIKATVRKIAQDGFFYEPVYHTDFQNREDTLLIFADVRGSMTPFHELTRRLISMAHTEGGHRRAPVYYFQNFPNEYVFEESNLSKPVKLETALNKANRQFTMAVIISDAGAARGVSTNQAFRFAQTETFLTALNATTAYTLWLNPMPKHRWKNTAAAQIAGKVSSMMPLLETDAPTHFTEILRLAARQHQNNNQ